MRVARSSTSSEWSPAGACRSCRRGSCVRTRRSARGRRTATSRPAQVDDEIVKALLAGRVVPVLGLAGSAALAERLATAFDYPRDRPLDLARVCQYVATMRGAGRLWDELHDRFEAAIEPEPIHRLLASLPPLLRERGVPHQLIVTTNYDLGLERAFEEAEEELDVVAYVASGPNQGGSGTGRRASRRGRWRCRTRTPSSRSTSAPSSSSSAAPSTRIRSGSGRASSRPRTTTSSSSAARSWRPRCRSRSPPGCAAATSSSSATRWPTGTCGSCSTASGEAGTSSYGSWAVQTGSERARARFWRHYDVDVLDIEPDALVALLDARARAAAPA